MTRIALFILLIGIGALLIGLGALLGARAGQICLICGTALALTGSIAIVVMS